VANALAQCLDPSDIASRPICLVLDGREHRTCDKLFQVVAGLKPFHVVAPNLCEETVTALQNIGLKHAYVGSVEDLLVAYRSPTHGGGCRLVYLDHTGKICHPVRRPILLPGLSLLNYCKGRCILPISTSLNGLGT
jgi:hypothetical protein